MTGLGSFCLKTKGSRCPCHYECVCLQASFSQTLLMPDGGGLDPNQHVNVLDGLNNRLLINKGQDWVQFYL